jgi:TolA-binding protein
MKKILTMLLVGLMVLSSFSVTFAEETNITGMESSLEVEQGPERFILMKEFTEEIHKVNELRIERNQLQIQVAERQDSLVDLYIIAKESKNKEAIESAKEKRIQLQAIHDEIKALHQQAAATKKDFREAVKNKDQEIANAAIENLIVIHTSINDQIEEKVEVLDMIIKLLS